MARIAHYPSIKLIGNTVSSVALSDWVISRLLFQPLCFSFSKQKSIQTNLYFRTCSLCRKCVFNGRISVKRIIHLFPWIFSSFHCQHFLCFKEACYFAYGRNLKCFCPLKVYLLPFPFKESKAVIQQAYTISDGT